MKLKTILFGALTATALMTASTGALANGGGHRNNASLYIGFNSNGSVSYGLNIGHPHVVVVPQRPRVVRHHPRPRVVYVQPRRDWRDNRRHWRNDRRHHRPVVNHHRPHPSRPHHGGHH